MYILQLMDSYAPSYGLLVVGFCECIVIAYVYGMNYEYYIEGHWSSVRVAYVLQNTSRVPVQFHLSQFLAFFQESQKTINFYIETHVKIISKSALTQNLELLRLKRICQNVHYTLLI